MMKQSQRNEKEVAILLLIVLGHFASKKLQLLLCHMTSTTCDSCL